MKKAAGGRFERANRLSPAGSASYSDVPFVEKEIPGKPFADVASRGGVDRPEMMLEGWATDFEAAIGRYVTSPAALLEILATSRRAVAVISCSGTDFRGRNTEWCGTGFLAGKNLFLTNNHVINSPEVAREAVVEFNFEATPESLLQAGVPRPGQTQKFKLDPARLFVTSPARNGLDYSFVWIEGAAQEAFGSIKMERGSFTAENGMQAFIIHHPQGQPKTVSLDDTEVFGITTRIIHYSSDTKEGSSGAPVFDPRGRLIALHHASRRQEVTLHDGGRSDTINEGIKIAAIALDLENRMRTEGADAAQAEAVLKEIGGSDTMTGFFGGLGRDIPSETASSETVVETYMGTDQDVDIGFWNVEVISTAEPELKKVEGVAQVVADLNFDVWGLPSVALQGVEAVVERIAEKYGDRYEFGAVDPHQEGGTAVLIWKKSVLECETVEWPSNVEPLFRKKVDLPGGKKSARIFDSYPGLFRLRTAEDMPDYECHVVLCNMDASGKQGGRLRLASRILARAMRDLAKETATDIIVCGNTLSFLAPDLAWTEEDGYSVLNALNEQEGRFLLLKGADSGIDDIFLSPGMKQTEGAAAGVTATKNVDLSEFVKDISERSPIAMRISLARQASSLTGAGDLDTLIDRLLASSSEPESSIGRGRYA